jgi:hypothetical protein
VKPGKFTILAPRTSYLVLLSPWSFLEVLDKGKAAAVTSIVETRDKASGKLVFENQSTVFIRGSGGFGGQREGTSESNYGSIRATSHILINSFSQTAGRRLPLTQFPNDSPTL